MVSIFRPKCYQSEILTSEMSLVLISSTIILFWIFFYLPQCSNIPVSLTDCNLEIKYCFQITETFCNFYKTSIKKKILNNIAGSQTGNLHSYCVIFPYSSGGFMKNIFNLSNFTRHSFYSIEC